MSKQISRRFCAAFCAVCMLACVVIACGFNVYAENGKMTLIIQSSEGEKISGVEWSVYKIAERKSEGEFELTGDFSDYPVILNDITTTSQMTELASELTDYAEENLLVSTYTATANAQGEGEISPCEVGVYLITGKAVITDTVKIIPSPMITEIKAEDLANGEISVYTKFGAEDLSSDSNSNSDSDLDSNSDSDSSTDSNSSDTNPSLPQTGLLWWPVPCLAAGGLILVATGIRINKRKK